MSGTHKHYIELTCPGCKEVVKLEIRLPTAIECNSCGMIFEARAVLMKEGK
ncbi:MAG: hypothetical protein NZ920_00410 [Aigarchaeota archaeon]|nr:hypothetical protein [Aigarchaeota archaeon]MDW8092801.1 hypothetical protein [Nitrososphaerota archaeon]